MPKLRGISKEDRESYRDYSLGTGTEMRQEDRPVGAPKSVFFADKNAELNDRGYYGKGPKGWKKSDEKIREEVCDALTESREVDASDVEVEVSQGLVFLKGVVTDRAAKKEAERLAESVHGVKDIRNEIRLRSTLQYPQDLQEPRLPS